MYNKTDRIAFLETLFADSNEFCRTHNMSVADDKTEYEEMFGVNYWTAKIEEMAEAARLGRSPAWKSACGWAKWQIEDEVATLSLYRWAAFQGSVHMGYAV